MSKENSARQGPIVGIDLGTTNSVVAIVKDGQPVVLQEGDEQILPSVVGIAEDGSLITGQPARNQLAAFPERTISSIKRRMGTMDRVQLGEESFTPPEISAMLLRRLRDRASRSLGFPIDRAVITVPAFFDENQRQATREAGELAGLRVERIINEPTAATLVYHAGSHDPKQVVVYDFGGGTFDVSVVRIEDGVIEVLSSKGDTKLGGDDFDEALMKSVADQFYDQHQIDLRDSAQSRFRLIQACERAKIQLSEQETAEIQEEFIAEKEGRPLNLVASITRSDYEQLIAPLVDRTIECVDFALRDAHLSTRQIDDLVLVGGSTRTPLVQDRLRGEFGREPKRAVDPDLAVALGAATQAAMLEGVTVGPVLVDVTGHTLGLEVAEGMTFNGPQLVFAPLIHRNSPLPARHEESYSKMHDSQETAIIHVLQGEHEDPSRNRSIGKFDLDLESGGGERSKIVVRFDLTLDGTLNVTATQPATGATKALTIDNALSEFHADDRERAEARLETMFGDSDELLNDTDWNSAGTGDTDLVVGGRVPNSSSNRERFAAATALLERAMSLSDNISGEDAEEIHTVSENLRRAIASDDDHAVITLTEELDDILFYVQ